MKFENILKDIQNKVYYPVYLLSGEETYYIDAITEFIENNILTDIEKEFNFTIVYGKEATPESIINAAKRYPMMSNYQVIIVKEAQDLNKIEELASYLAKPLKSTILVLCYKYKKPDKRKKYVTIIEKNGVFFHSEKLKDDKIPAWIKQYIEKKGFKIDDVNIQLLADSLGNDLNKITNELNKLFINIAIGGTITKDVIQENIGISKEYNIFELQHQLAKRSVQKTNQIITHFTKHPKENSLMMTISVLHEFFIRVMIVQQLQASKASDKDIAVAIERPPFFLNDFKVAARNYSTAKLMQIIHLMREYDLKFKGVGFPTFNESALYNELFFKILH